MKKFLVACSLSLGLSLGYAQTFSDDPSLNYAISGQVADVGITLGMIAEGSFVESNPLGVGLLVLKPSLIAYSNGLEGEEKNKALHITGAVGWSAFWHNLAILAGANPATGVVVLLGTLLYELDQYRPLDAQVLETKVEKPLDKQEK